jgi:hypothetical protein
MRKSVKPEIEGMMPAPPAPENLSNNDSSSAATQPEPAEPSTTIVESSKNAKRVKEKQQRNEAVTAKLATRPVARRFEMMASLIDMVMRRIHPSVLICGPGGIGKSYMVKAQLKKRGFVKDKLGKKGFSWIAGHISPTGIYEAMHNRKDGGVLVLDDVDIWTGANASTGMELCKAALDSYDERVISWHSSWAESHGLPRNFNFNGQVIFITNRRENQIPQPLLDRCFYIPVVLKWEEIIERMEQIIPKMYPKVPLEQKLQVLEHLKATSKPGDPISFRTLDRGIRLRVGLAEHPSPDEWKDFIDVFGI